MTTLRLAGIQHDIASNDRAANFAHLEPMINAAAAAGAGLVLLAETFSTGFLFMDESIAGAFCEPEGGPSSQFLMAQADRHQIWIGGSCPEIAPEAVAARDPRPSNTFVLAGPGGVVHRYRKIHPFTYAGEDRYVRPGEQFVTVDIAGFRISLFICYDLRFADEFWQLANDTDLYLVPANWPTARRTAWTTLLRARAIENLAYVAGVNRVGTDGSIEYSGDSCIVDPVGEVLATATDTESILLADLSTERVAEVRERFGFLQDRRS
jgi:predicted amidohydrolase